MAGSEQVTGQQSGAHNAACVLLVDTNRTRRMMLASTFRGAGCTVVDTGKEQDVVRTLAANKKSWVLVVVDAACSQAFCNAYPATPIVRVGGEHEKSIAGRISVSVSPQLASRVHSMAAMRGSVE